jgi:hypothetical protein
MTCEFKSMADEYPSIAAHVEATIASRADDA